jgi:hypothetical protein
VAEPLVRETQDLYGLPLSQFTAARNARAKALRKSDPQLAAAVAALPKPSVAAGALNELVHEDPSEVRALVQSGKRLRQAQEAAVAGTKGADLNEAIKEHRVALDRVQRDLRRRKLSGATVDRATQTLRVASLDPELWPLLERGLLHEDLTASGFGLDPGIVPARPQQKQTATQKPAAKKHAPPSKPKPDKKAAEQRQREARERLREAKAALAEVEKRARTVARELERARADVERAQQRLGRGLNGLLER